MGRGKTVGSGRAVGRISIAVGSGVVTGVGSGCVELHPSFNNLIAPSIPSSVRIKCGISMEAPGCNTTLYAFPHSKDENLFKNAGSSNFQLA